MTGNTSAASSGGGELATGQIIINDSGVRVGYINLDGDYEEITESAVITVRVQCLILSNSAFDVTGDVHFASMFFAAIMVAEGDFTATSR